ncbi:MAG: hypothetical protein IIA44_12085 [Acidobacteria bacterium]|nr:hypothetical protein [Acidobacteriota bacterium]
MNVVAVLDCLASKIIRLELLAGFQQLGDTISFRIASRCGRGIRRGFDFRCPGVRLFLQPCGTFRISFLIFL